MQTSRFIQELPGALIRQEGDDPELDANEKRERAQVHLEALRAKFGA